MNEIVHLTLDKDSYVKIDRIDVFPFRYPMVGYFKFFADGRGAGGRAAVIVKITADDGTVGWGQSVPVETWSYETLETTIAAIRDYYAPELIGQDPTDIVGAHRNMDEVIAPAFSNGGLRNPQVPFCTRSPITLLADGGDYSLDLPGTLPSEKPSQRQGVASLPP